MPMRPKVTMLPLAVRTELYQRLVATNFGRLQELAEWLNSAGHPIGKSALSKHAVEHRAAIVADVQRHRATAQRPSATVMLDLRIRCLEAAAANGMAQGTLARAAAYLDWVTGSD